MPKIEISAEPAAPPEAGVKVHVRKGEDMDDKKLPEPIDITDELEKTGTLRLMPGHYKITRAVEVKRIIRGYHDVEEFYKGKESD